MTQQTAAQSQAGAQLGSRAKKSLGPCPRHRTTSRDRELNQGRGPLPGPLGNKSHLDAEGTLLRDPTLLEFSSEGRAATQRPLPPEWGAQLLWGAHPPPVPPLRPPLSLGSGGGLGHLAPHGENRPLFSQAAWHRRGSLPECQGAPSPRSSLPSAAHLRPQVPRGPAKLGPFCRKPTRALASGCGMGPEMPFSLSI